jgi:hypothetical protein
MELMRIEVVFLDGRVVTVEESTFSRALARAAMVRVEQGASTRNELTPNEKACVYRGWVVRDGELENFVPKWQIMRMFPRGIKFDPAYHVRFLRMPVWLRYIRIGYVLLSDSLIPRPRDHRDSQTRHH